MDEQNEVIKCPSCGHENAPYVDKCIICDFSISTYRNQPQTRNMLNSHQSSNETSSPMNKQLGPLPDSDFLVDKHKKTKPSISRILMCPECNTGNRAGTLMCTNCGARLPQHTPTGAFNTDSPPKPTPDETDDESNVAESPPVDDTLFDRKTKPSITRILKCPECGLGNAAGSLYCSNCGNVLKEKEDSKSPDNFTDSAETQKEIPSYSSLDSTTDAILRSSLNLNQKQEIPLPPDTMDDIKDIPIGCIKFTHWMSLNLQVLGHDNVMAVYPREDKSLLIGRQHESLPVQPQIDLTPYLDDKHGVSRRHALLRLRGARLDLQDLNSTNGTSINGVRFAPKEIHQIRHGDIIQLGQIRIKVEFVSRVKSSSSGDTQELS